MSQGPRVAVGRVSGHRGGRGELTVRIAAADRELFDGLPRVFDPKSERWIDVEASRSYADRLVLKLAGIDDANEAAALRGRLLEASRDDLPESAADEVWVDDWVGLEVVETGRVLGRVIGLVPTGGTDLLEIERADGGTFFVPLAREMLKAVDLETGRLEVELPEGLERLNDGVDEDKGGD